MQAATLLSASLGSEASERRDEADDLAETAGDVAGVDGPSDSLRCFL